MLTAGSLWKKEARLQDGGGGGVGGDIIMVMMMIATDR